MHRYETSGEQESVLSINL